MHLKQLKLAGFKSFVDPVIIPFPGRLVAIVGPNGCGKSNIVDAVRLVLGESSAKNLRGDSIIDFIFNGSSHRKATGQASIELIFDNSPGRLTGPYANYQELAVKRLITRDGESVWYLNGSRCRRRDITDLFLGTGVGARYSIIGQETVSRLITARPEELKACLEEAAGVSRYKERRRETLLRIEHTRENLTRVADIRDELDKQLQRLERQAKAAERYQILKAEERRCKADILALKWQDLGNAQKIKQQQREQLELDYGQHQAKAAEISQQNTALRGRLQDESAIFQSIQTTFYGLATDIARLEEGMRLHQREKQRLQDDERQMQIDWQEASSQLQQDRQAREDSHLLLARLQMALLAQQADVQIRRHALAEKQEQQNSWNANLQQVQTALSRAQREEQVEQVRLQHLDEKRQQIQIRLEKIQAELQRIETDTILGETLNAQRALLPALQASLQLDDERHQQMLATGALLRRQAGETEKDLHQAQDSVHRLTMQQASLLAAQHTALGRDMQQTEGPGQWRDKPRLAETIEVEKPWRFACEMVLAEGLQAIVLDSLDALWPEISGLQGRTSLFLTASQTTGNGTGPSRLSDKISGFKPDWIHDLDKIYTASSLDEACLYLSSLGPHESVITADGCWLGKGWLKIASAETQNETSLLQRQDELTQVKEKLAMAQNALSVLKARRDSLHARIRENDWALETSKQSLSASRENQRSCEAEIAHNERALRQAETGKKILAEEAHALGCTLEELADQNETARRLLAAATGAAKQYAEEQSLILRSKATGDEALSTCRQRLDEAERAVHQSQLQADREALKIQQLDAGIQREQLRFETLDGRLKTLNTRLAALETPDAGLHGSLNEKILRHRELEADLAIRQKHKASMTEKLDALEAAVRQEDNAAKTLQEKISQVQMEEQSLIVRASGLLENLLELDTQAEVLLATIPPGTSPDLRAQALLDIGEKIKRLGAINLAAIGEYDSEFQRKNYLDEQHQDLAEALATLEAVIGKMDKETQQCLQLAFDGVNKAFQTLFPRLFGGGRAMLELTCDNLLEAGILVMAQPPGKRNSTIHLLSGGEKALTAVALVFAIFQLNPSPFCILDEVDASLDDVNVGRFCDLVNEMSHVVQFLFVTHNRIAMELAGHLIGVTMREPGVSRVVAVDVEEALSMS